MEELISNLISIIVGATDQQLFALVALAAILLAGFAIYAILTVVKK